MEGCELLSSYADVLVMHHTDVFAHDMVLSLEKSTQELHRGLAAFQQPLKKASQLCGSSVVHSQVQDFAKGLRSWSGALVVSTQQQVDAAIERDAALQAVLRSGLEQARSVEKGVLELLEQLREVQEALQEGAQASSTWAGAHRARHVGWCNSHGSSLLLSLPPEVLHTIAHKAGKHTRAACTALRAAYLAPGSGVRLPSSSSSFLRQLQTLRLQRRPSFPLARSTSTTTAPPAATPPLHARPISDASTAELNAHIARWRYPESVTHLATSGYLQASTCAAIAAAFPRLRRVALAAGAEPGACAALSPNILSLTVPAPPLSDSLAHFTGLRALSLVACRSADAAASLAALTALRQLSRLSLTAAPRERGSGAQERECAARAPPLALGVWAVLAALPRLAHLCLDVPMDYCTDMPDVAPLAGVTHLTLQFAAAMVLHNERAGGGAVPLARVLRLLPALASLQLWAEQTTYPMVAPPQLPARACGLLAEAISALPLQHLDLGRVAHGIGRDNLAAFLPTALESLRSDVILLLSPASFAGLLPHELPITSLDVFVKATRSARDVAGALGFVALRLPRLARLALRSYDVEGVDVLGAAAAADLRCLSGLRQLSVASRQLARALVPALPTLPALTRLELPAGVDAADAAALVPLTALRSLHVGDCEAGGKGARGAAAVVQAARQMRGLTELVLQQSAAVDGGAGDGEGELQEDLYELYERLVPPPAMLRRLVVPTEQGLPAALRMLGQYVDEICCAPVEGC